MKRMVLMGILCVVSTISARIENIVVENVSGWNLSLLYQPSARLAREERRLEDGQSERLELVPELNLLEPGNVFTLDIKRSGYWTGWWAVETDLVPAVLEAIRKASPSHNTIILTINSGYTAWRIESRSEMSGGQEIPSTKSFVKQMAENPLSLFTSHITMQRVYDCYISKQDPQWGRYIYGYPDNSAYKKAFLEDWNGFSERYQAAREKLRAAKEAVDAWDAADDADFRLKIQARDMLNSLESNLRTLQESIARSRTQQESIE